MSKSKLGKNKCTCALSGGLNITILAGLSLVAPHAEASVVPNADPRVFTRRLALRLRIEDKGVRDSSGRVGARSARPRERSQQRQEEQAPPGARTHELHGSTGEKTLLWRNGANTSFSTVAERLLRCVKLRWWCWCGEGLSESDLRRGR